ncbi:AbrB family transcriptional regulator [Parasphingorhabdus sp.]|uniref:AbrB family transcriptional regulator n=1 Tax=Parasphingorhabdus sp. TaxID=2709688 RepID=UPI0032EE5A75
MGKEWKAKAFKSGNSIALRMPKALGFQDGDEVRVVQHSDGSFSFWKESDAKKVFMSLYGSMSAGFMAEGRGDIEQDDRAWDLPTKDNEAG